MPTSLGTGAGRLVLRPGTPVMTRGPGVVQVGLTGAIAHLPDDPAVRRLLAALARSPGHAVDLPLPEAADRALSRLCEAALVVPAPPQPAPPGLATLLAQFGADAERRLASRAATRVVVLAGRDGGSATPLTALATDLLDQAGLAVVETTAEPDAVRLVVHAGPVPREALDDLVRDSVPHLVVAGDAAGIRLGPFVEPGRTACLRCVDAHESVPDQRRPLLLAQAAEQARTRPAPRDPLLDHLALAWAVRDLARYAEGDEPSTWSATVDLGPTAPPQHTPWGRHPYCGCAWDAFVELP